MSLLLWCGLSLAAVVYLTARMAEEQTYLRSALTGTVVSLSFILWTVFSHVPFEAPYLFILGLCATWRNRQLNAADFSMADE